MSTQGIEAQRKLEFKHCTLLALFYFIPKSCPKFGMWPEGLETRSLCLMIPDSCLHTCSWSQGGQGDRVRGPDTSSSTLRILTQETRHTETILSLLRKNDIYRCVSGKEYSGEKPEFLFPKLCGSPGSDRAGP